MASSMKIQATIVIIICSILLGINGLKFHDTIGRAFNVVYKNNEFFFNTTNLLSGTQCQGFHACHLKNGTFEAGYTIDADSIGLHNTLGYFRSTQKSKINGSFEKVTDEQCPLGYHIQIHTHCSTHWHPPIHLPSTKCKEVFEWNSPFGCSNTNVVNEESPCYTYNKEGQLISLIPLIKSDGSDYQVDTSNFSDSHGNFHINVCNEASKKCSPNVASCYTSKQNGTIEAGFNNLTRVEWDLVENATTVTYLGQHEASCKDQRTRTIIRFRCPSKIRPKTKPTLVKISPCESVIDWVTLYACPESNTTAKATSCSLKLDQYNIKLDILDLTNNRNEVDVGGIRLNNTDWTMKLGICQGLSNYPCAGKQLSTETACLIPKKEATAKQSHSESQIVGSIIDGSIRLTDSTVIVEYPTAEVCISPGETQATAQKLSTRIEFFCDTNITNALTEPKFLGYEDCSYVFSWPSKRLCQLLDFEDHPTKATKEISKIGEQIEKPLVTVSPKSTNSTSSVVDLDHHEQKETPIVEHGPQSGKELHDKTLKDANAHINIAQENLQTPVHPSSDNKVNDAGGNRAHKIIMISLILISFISCFVIIVYLNAKTRLTRPLNNSRSRSQQAANVPYRRVLDDYGENGDL